LPKKGGKCRNEGGNRCKNYGLIDRADLLESPIEVGEIMARKKMKSNARI
jgi:hypothetical protein